jgi:hypothetical protein
MSWKTLRVFAIFLLGGTLIAAHMIWLTTPLLTRIERPEGDVLVVGWIATFALGLVWILPAQCFVAAAAALQFSFLKRFSWPFVVFIIIPLAALIVTYRDVADCCDRLVPSDIRKLLYWTLIVAPAEVLCAWYVSKVPYLLGHQQLPAGER